LHNFTGGSGTKVPSTGTSQPVLLTNALSIRSAIALADSMQFPVQFPQDGMPFRNV
jgi:hypothetical protein